MIMFALLVVFLVLKVDGWVGRNHIYDTSQLDTNPDPIETTAIVVAFGPNQPVDATSRFSTEAFLQV